MIKPYEVPLDSPKYRAYMFVMSKIHDLKLKSRFYPDEYTRQVNHEIDVIRKQLLAFCWHTMPRDDFAAEESARQYPRFDGSKWIAPSDPSDPSDQSDQLVLRSFSEGGSDPSDESVQSRKSRP